MIRKFSACTTTAGNSIAHTSETSASQGNDVTEFLDDVPWARHPYTDLNDSSSFHIMEGRWLRNPQYLDSLVDHLYTGGGNDRHFSESIAAATFAWTQVTGDTAPALRHLDAMQHIYNLWDDHFDAERGLYWIEPLLDATEYTISSIDASGAGFTDSPSKRDFENGFTGGYSFRPSINASQFGNAKAIARLAEQSGHKELALEYDRRAEALRSATLHELWNPALNHFTDIYQRSTPFVKAGSFIRGRELVGLVPWTFELPPESANESAANYNAAWQHVLAKDELDGAFGLRTVEPSYAKYLHQYRYDKATGQPECQWNGPSWPFQTSQALTAMSNLLQDYKQQEVSANDFVRLLRQYTHQHIAPNGDFDLQEDYNPDTGEPIVGLPRSHHYNHSTYIDVVLTGLLGIRPRSDDTFEIDPLLPLANSGEQRLHFFALQSLRYHGHDLSVVFDETGDRYGLGKGLSVFEDSKRVGGAAHLQKLLIPLAHKDPTLPGSREVDIAVNAWARTPTIYETDLPIVTGEPHTDDAHLYQAIDGRMWFFAEIANGWSPTPSVDTVHGEPPYTFAVDLRHSARVDAAELYFFADEKNYFPPTSYRIQARVSGAWQDVPDQRTFPAVPLGNGLNRITFPSLKAQEFRIQLTPSPKGNFRLIECKLLHSERASNRN